MIVLAICTPVYAHDTLEFTNSSNFNAPSGWYEEEIELFANQKAELGKYALKYRLILNGFYLEDLCILDISEDDHNLIIDSIDEIYKRLCFK